MAHILPHDPERGAAFSVRPDQPSPPPPLGLPQPGADGVVPPSPGPPVEEVSLELGDGHSTRQLGGADGVLDAVEEAVFDAGADGVRDGCDDAVLDGVEVAEELALAVEDGVTSGPYSSEP
jgi:hypothetical protein